MEGLQQAYILGRKRDIYFGLPAVEYVYEKIDAGSFARLSDGSFKTTDVKLITHFVYAGLKGGCELNDEKEDLAFKDVYPEIERMLMQGDEHGVMAAVGNAFSESNSVKWLSKSKAAKSKKK